MRLRSKSISLSFAVSALLLLGAVLNPLGVSWSPTAKPKPPAPISSIQRNAGFALPTMHLTTLVITAQEAAYIEAVLHAQLLAFYEALLQQQLLGFYEAILASQANVLETTGPVWDCIIQHESNGIPTVVNSSSGAGGLYQFMPSTWIANGGGQYAPVANEASPHDQSVIAVQVQAADGWQPWAGDPCVG